MGSVEDALAALQSGQLVAYGAKGDDLFGLIPPIEWTHLEIAPLQPERHYPYSLIQFARSDVLSVFPPTETARMSHAEVVQWCEAWIAEGHGNGMDKAWAAFKMLPGAVGLSRDDSFRPAWREAKTKPRTPEKSRDSTRLQS